MKKVYMPSNEILMSMQAHGCNIHEYLIVKLIESLIIEGINNTNNGILKNADKELQEDWIITRSVCILYPDELEYSNIAKRDLYLIKRILEKSKDNKIYNLDYLQYFENGINENADDYYTYAIIDDAIDTLAEKIAISPEYRFEYKSKLLDDIFSTAILTYKMPWTDKIYKMSKIDPAYALLIKSPSFFTENRLRQLLSDSIRDYTYRYGVSDIESKEIDLYNPDEDTKKLIKRINSHRNNLY